MEPSADLRVHFLQETQRVVKANLGNRDAVCFTVCWRLTCMPYHLIRKSWMGYVITCKCSSGWKHHSVRLRKKKDRSHSSDVFIREITTSFFFFFLSFILGNSVLWKPESALEICTFSLNQCLLQRAHACQHLKAIMRDILRGNRGHVVEMKEDISHSSLLRGLYCTDRSHIEWNSLLSRKSAQGK